MAIDEGLFEAEAARHRAAAEAAEAAEAEKEYAAAEAAAAERAAKADEAERSEKERARLAAIAGLSPEHIAKAEELANWDFIKGSESSQDFRDHLARFPEGVTARMARSKLEALVWSGLTQPADPSSLQRFLEEFPKGLHVGEAKSKLAELESSAAAAREAEERQRRETEAWAAASAAGNSAALKAFLQDWPDSQHAKAARARVNEIKGQPTRRRFLLGVGVALGVLASLLAVQVQIQPGYGLLRFLYDQSTRTLTTEANYSIAFSLRIIRPASCAQALGRWNRTSDPYLHGAFQLDQLGCLLTRWSYSAVRQRGQHH
jgi:hypothetical protein